MTSLPTPEDNTPQEPITLRQRVASSSTFLEYIKPFYFSLFPQLDMTEEEIEDFITTLDTEHLFNQFYNTLLAGYGGEEELLVAVDSLEKYHTLCSKAFEIVPFALDSYLERKRSTSH